MRLIAAADCLTTGFDWKDIKRKLDRILKYRKGARNPCTLNYLNRLFITRSGNGRSKSILLFSCLSGFSVGLSS
jgi:hypothetical protein